jgi:lactoylglutathione lyase
MPSQHRNQLGLTHLSFFVDDVDDVAARLTDLGGTVQPRTRAALGYDVLFFADPDGTRVELMGPLRTGTTPRFQRVIE